MAISTPEREEDGLVPSSAPTTTVTSDPGTPGRPARALASTRGWLRSAAAAVPLNEGLSGRHNALGLIRIILAAAVIVSHGFPLSGRGEDPVQRWSENQQNLGGFAVIGFFAISGYLITKSGTRNDILQYMWARILRIFPAFLAVLVLSAFVIGPVFWLAEGRSLQEYFTAYPAGPLQYITGNWQLTIHQWGINDIFAQTPYGQAVGGGSVFNGSLWTLTYEWTCYLIIGAFVLFGVLKRFRILLPLLTLVLLGMQMARFSGAGFNSIVPYLGDQFLVNLGLIFMIGGTFALYADKIVLDWRLFLFCSAISVFTAFKGGFQVVGFPAFAYVLFWLAAKLPDAFKRLFAKNDYSYGLYVWGFLVQQMVAQLGWYRFGYVPYTLICLVIAGAFAWASWHGVEKHALAIKSWGPGRGLRYWWSRVRRTAPAA
ncbi:acyltransferase family protein [Leifsonia sp. NPDC058194]|uniref:acyltransferase family protein n=1 Tax=Leifsonia sp. NPDC058194 TaxID=3346374 RepID=UPI0036DADB37